MLSSTDVLHARFMRRNATKRIISLLLTAVLLLSVCGCTSSTAKKIPTYFTDSPIVAARFYYFLSQDEEYNAEYLTEELDPDRIGALTDRLNSMDLIRHGFHTDYYWAYKMGVEMELADGTYLLYDGTKLVHSRLPVEGSYKSHDNETILGKDFLEVSNCDYWEEMTEFFPSMKDHELYTTSW